MNFIPDQTTAVETTFWRAWFLPNSCCGNAIMFSPLRWGWLGLSPTYWGWKKRVRKKNRPSWVWNGMLSLKLSIFSRFWSCFPHGFVYVSWQCGCHVSLELKVGTRWWSNGHGIATTDRQRTIKAIIDPLFKRKKKNKKLAVWWVYYHVRFFFARENLLKKKLKVGQPEPPEPPRAAPAAPHATAFIIVNSVAKWKCSTDAVMSEQASDGRQQICFRGRSAGGGHQARYSSIPMFADAKLECTPINENNKKLRYLLFD